jgi:N-acetylmuramoyl-L-alanine amidase
MKVIRKNLCEFFAGSCQDSSGMHRSPFCRSGFAVSAGFFFNKAFARVSPVFAVALLAACSFAISPIFAASTSSSSAAGADPSATVKRQAASSQFARAEDQRSDLNSKPADKRTLADYKHVVDSYRRVYLITPHANEVPDALLAVAELYTEMGDRFGRSYFQSAVDTYQFLMREYPKSRYCQDAYLRSAKLQKDQLDDVAGAVKTYEAFLKKFPRSPRRREAQEARAELALLQNSAPAGTSKNSLAKSSDLEAEKPEPARITPQEAPIEAPVEVTKNSTSPKGGAPAENGRVPLIHKISTKAAVGSTRVTINLDGSVQYMSGRIGNPDRIYFDLRAARLVPDLVHAKIKTDGALVCAVRVAQNPAGVVRVVLDVNGVKDYTAALLSKPNRLVIDLYANGKTTQTAEAAGNTVVDAPATENVAVALGSKPAERVRSATPIPARTPNADASESAAIPQPKNKLATAKIGKASGKSPDLVQPASAPQPTRDGNSTLTRALGLKIGRIVIDAGHGGHDTGTIGPTGLMEKDLCLDIALRLGKIIQQRLPTADVVFTRSDDTFIPLEERTHIANESKADMFISIHANSSQDPGARGIETYYLNLKGSAEAMEVAARENATDDQGIHELQDLVKQIARTEKIDESKEFAEDVQDSLAKRVQKAARPVKNRGVRKAPFVVLIGADMPSILTEISFLSNAADEKMLKQPDHRQRVAEGIYQGVANYLQSLNSMTVNQSSTPAPKRTTTSAEVETAHDRN